MCYRRISVGVIGAVTFGFYLCRDVMTEANHVRVLNLHLVVAVPIGLVQRPVQGSGVRGLGFWLRRQGLGVSGFGLCLFVSGFGVRGSGRGVLSAGPGVGEPIVRLSRGAPEGVAGVEQTRRPVIIEAL